MPFWRHIIPKVELCPQFWAQHAKDFFWCEQIILAFYALAVGILRADEGPAAVRELSEDVV